MNIGDVIFIAPYCSTKFEVGQIAYDTPDGHWVVKMWGIRHHPRDFGSGYTYGRLTHVMKENAWSPDRLGEALSAWLDRESNVRG
jgi:hypothetical protein